MASVYIETSFASDLPSAWFDAPANRDAGTSVGVKMSTHVSNSKPSSDPLIEEVREIRRELSDQFNNDVVALGRYLQKQERETKTRIVRQPPPSNTAGRAG